MRKLFFLIPALVLSLAMNADVIYITPTSPYDSDALRRALNNAADGDIIEMAAGTYVESPSNYIAFNGKHVTVRAAAGAEVLIQPQVPITISNGGCAHFENVKIDASHLTDVNNYSHSIYPTDASKNNRIILEGCEIYGFNLVNSAIYCGSSNKLDAVSFNNCYFHNMMKSILFIESTAGTAVQISNSTFANIETSSSYYAGVIDSRATSGSFSVDHCTFYNCQVINTDYGTIGKVATPGAVVSNCIFAMPESTDGLRAIRDVAQANNCLTFNYAKDSGKGIHDGVEKNNCIFVDPLFTDAANEDYSFAGNWVTMSISPARGAATDGSDLGDPRWYTPGTYYTTDFAAPGYAFTIAKASTVDAGIEVNEHYGVDNPYLRYTGSTPTSAKATWLIEATRACYVDVTINMANNEWEGKPDGTYQNGKHIFGVELWDENNVRLDTVAEGLYENGSSLDGYSTYPTIHLGSLYIPEPGVYTVKLLNCRSWSKCGVSSITMTYSGGDTIQMPGTTDINDAWFSSNGTRADGKISFSTYENAWVKWNVRSTIGGTCNVKLYIENTTDLGHAFVVNIYETTEGTPLFSETWNSSYSTTDPIEIDCGSFTFAAGVKYIIKVTNNEFNSEAKVINVVTTYLSGGTVNIPANPVPFADATLSQYASIDGSGYLHFADDDHVWLMADQYAKWNIHANAGVYHFIAHACSPNDYSNIQFRILQNDNEIYSYKPQYTFKKADETITSPDWFLDGDYTLEVSNPANHSHGYLLSLAASAIEDEFIIFDENAEDMSVINANDGVNTKKLVLKRSFVAGMYNTICMPFNEDSNTQLTKIFGEGYDLLEMTGATIEGSVLTLDFATPANKIKYGRPYLIKPTKNVVNPVFNAHTVSKSVSHLVQPEASSADASFIGIYTPTVLDQQRDLFVGQNNKVHFPSNDNKLKGLRAYFHVTANAQAIKRARIVTREEVITEIDLVNGENNGVIKTIENGQLIINIDGIRFNIMGTKIQ